MAEAETGGREEDPASSVGSSPRAAARRMSPGESEFEAIDLSVLSDAATAPIPVSAFGGAMRTHMSSLKWTVGQMEELMATNDVEEIASDMAESVDEIVELLRRVRRRPCRRERLRRSVSRHWSGGVQGLGGLVRGRVTREAPSPSSAAPERDAPNERATRDARSGRDRRLQTPVCCAGA